MVQDILGPASPGAQGGAAPAGGADDEAATALQGRIEMQRRRVTKDGRVKLKLTLLGAVVDKCGICLSQFKDRDEAMLGPKCQHAYHDRCLRRWLAMNRTCPICREALSLGEE
ncbi:hypothetical protein WOLCODRAFT_158678 [Wolfiporia cocos MD-104 SS10]|uniref:RING-type domain-containing protein n=1 Tax=Wolfiporia cocos (strain MD-104) TaxID=742152 RepID=A0A2H3JH15_WOLCO|nr:hypothetical protein WOLCODRAFT_158678 [Wolfiporia cocos MD-104 SS10]